MGAVCSAGVMSPRDEDQDKSSGFSGKLNPIRSFRQKKNSYSEPVQERCETPHTYDSGELLYSISRELKPSTPARSVQNKVPQRSSFFGRAGIVGLERAVEVLDTLGSGVANLNSGGGFVSGMASRGNRICILAFEIANTVTKGANLMHSLSEESIQFLKKEVLHSQGVQKLVSTDMKELESIAAADKRNILPNKRQRNKRNGFQAPLKKEEFALFSREVIRFGHLCKDPQWHNLDRLFSKLELEPTVNKQQKEEADMTIQELSTLAQYTAELYHELNSLDRFEQDYRRKVEEVESLNLPRKGEGVMMLYSEVKHQRKLVRSLKKKSLWAKSLEEVVEKLVDIVTFIYQEISKAFEESGVENTTEGSMFVSKDTVNPARLGVSGLALHYANVINQIDNIASRPSYLPPTIRDQLYHGLPNSVKVALRTRCLTFEAKEELTLPQIRAEMEKTLNWLVPVATNTTKAHQGFGWIGEWANTGETSKKGSEKVIRLQSLYHADKQKTDVYILELLTWLHRLVGITTHSTIRIRPVHVRSPTNMELKLKPSPTDSQKDICCTLKLSTDDRNLLDKVMNRKKIAPGISKSQEFSLAKKRGSKVWALSRSTGSSPRRRFGPSKSSFLDVLDGLDS